MSDETTRIEVEQTADPRVDLAVERTQLALERTHLAWIRTTFAIITAGIAIDKGFEIIHQQRMLHNEALIKNAHFVGLGLTSFGTLLLFIETLQFVRRNKQLSAIMKKGYGVFSIDVFLSGMVLLLGLTLIYLMIASG
jgi:putative membrane protein